MNKFQICNELIEKTIEERQNKKLTPKEARGQIRGIILSFEACGILNKFQVMVLTTNAFARIK